MNWLKSLVAVMLLTGSLSAQQMVPWLTRAADNQQSGWNSHETLLTQALIASKGVTRRTIIPVTGDARGMEAQPLILPAVSTPRGVRDVMVLPSMANVVRGVDAHDGTGIWSTSLGAPVTGSPMIDMHGINQHWGCLSTGVIDATTRRLYQVCWASPDGSGSPLTARYYMNVLNVGDGSIVGAPILIQGTSQSDDFNAQMRKQRASLVEATVAGVRTVFGCAGTVSETSRGSAGYCFAFDVKSNTLTALTALTAGQGAGVWMSGASPSADKDGNLFLVTGNGAFDGVTQLGETFLKLTYIPPTPSTPASLTVTDHWTPWTDLSRAGQVAPPGPKLAGAHAPSEALRQPVGGGMSMSLRNARARISMTADGPLLLVYPQMAQGAWADQDWGSAGPACLFQIGVCIVTGKDGIAYPIKAYAMGGTTLADLAHSKTNCAKLAAPPVWATMNPGPVDPCPTNTATLNFFPRGVTAHLHMTPVQMYDPLLQSWTLFLWGENSQLHKWKVSDTGAMTYVAQSHEFASADARGTSPGGMTGGFCAGSSNGGDPNSAILVCTIPYGNANAVVGPGRMLVYDPIHLAADGSLKVLWDSQRWGVAFLFNKFDPPLIDGGEVIVPNYNGGVDVYAP
ncbi:MAG TPA: hypothetical protein VGP83_17160 [Pyrinomonadaceae bacterium]|jgi:hypothetical protein|nr:hypothetical protein [Pyrinomonadaceae bacterium]